MALRKEFSEVTPELQEALQSIRLPEGMSVTSLISGPHVKNSAHFDGRAVDVSLPHTKAAYDFVVNAIGSGRFARIGTTQSLVDRLGEYAAQHGVEMFVDEGTGSHAHLEVH